MHFYNFKSYKITLKYILYFTQNYLVIFLPIYLKYLTMTPFEIGVIRGLQTWVTIIITLIGTKYIINRFESTRQKKLFICVSLIAIIIVNCCLIFIPLPRSEENVTHCYISNDGNFSKMIHTPEHFKKHTLLISRGSNKSVFQNISTSNDDSFAMKQDGTNISTQLLNRNNSQRVNILPQLPTLNTEVMYKTKMKESAINVSEKQTNAVVLNSSLNSISIAKPVSSKTYAENGDPYHSEGIPKTIQSRLPSQQTHNPNQYIRKYKHRERFQGHSGKYRPLETDKNISMPMHIQYDNTINNDGFINRTQFQKSPNDTVSHRRQNSLPTLRNDKHYMDKITPTMLTEESYSHEKSQLRTNQLSKYTLYKYHNNDYGSSGNSFEYSRPTSNLFHSQNHSDKTLYAKRLLKSMLDTTQEIQSGRIRRNSKKFPLSQINVKNSRPTYIQWGINGNPLERKDKLQSQKRKLMKQNEMKKRFESYPLKAVAIEANGHWYRYVPKPNTNENERIDAILNFINKHSAKKKMYQLPATHRTNENHNLLINNPPSNEIKVRDIKDIHLDPEPTFVSRNLKSLILAELPATISSRTDNYSLDEVNKVHASHLDHWRIDDWAKWSITFWVLLMFAIIFEVFSTASNLCLEDLSEEEDDDDDDFDKTPWESGIADNYKMILVWSIIGCPLLVAVTVSWPCPDQLVAIFVLDIIFLAAALLIAVFAVNTSTRRFKYYSGKKKEIDQYTSSLQSFGSCLSSIVTGSVTACTYEYILWHMANLQGFSYNYMWLYGGYFAVSALAQVPIRLYMKRVLRVNNSVLEFDEGFYQDQWWDSGCDGTILQHPQWIQLAGSVCLMVHLFVLPFHPVWAILFLGPLSGISTALYEFSSKRNLTSWTVGYGAGCLTGGLIIQVWSSEIMFWTAATALFIWSVLHVICYSLTKCRRDQPYNRLLLVQEVSSTNIEPTDWLEKALRDELKTK